MPVPTAITDLSQTAGSNSPDGSESPTSTDDYLRTLSSFLALIRDGKGLSAEVDLASAATCDIGGQNSPFVRITGTTTITSFGTDYQGPRFLRFAASLTLTHNSATLILPGAGNIITAAGDTCIATPISGGWVVSHYARGTPPSFRASNTTNQSVTSATFTKVTFGSETFDTGACFSSSRFTPNVAGYYDVKGLIRMGATGASSFAASIYKNGSEYSRGMQVVLTDTNSNAQNLTVEDVLYLNGSTDYIELYGSVDGTSPSFQYVNSAVCCRFSAQYLRP